MEFKGTASGVIEELSEIITSTRQNFNKSEVTSTERKMTFKYYEGNIVKFGRILFRGKELCEETKDWQRGKTFKLEVDLGSIKDPRHKGSWFKDKKFDIEIPWLEATATKIISYS